MNISIHDKIKKIKRTSQVKLQNYQINVYNEIYKYFEGKLPKICDDKKAIIEEKILNKLKN